MNDEAGSIQAFSVSEDGWTATMTLKGFGKTNTSVSYNLFDNLSPKVSLTITESSGVTREVFATSVVRNPYPNQNDLDHFIVGDDLVVKVALSDYVFSSSQVSVSAQPGWATTLFNGELSQSAQVINTTAQNLSNVDPEEATSIGNFITPDKQVVADSIYAELIAASIFAEVGAEVDSVRFVARDQEGNEVSVTTDSTSLSNWGKGDATPVYSYSADIPTAGLTEGSLITVSAVITDHNGLVHKSAPHGSVPSKPTAFTDQVYLLDADGSFGKAFAYVDASASGSQGAANSDPALAAAAPFKTIAAALIAVQVYNQANFGRNNVDHAEIRLMEGQHVWVDGALSQTNAVSDDVWVTITRDPTALKQNVLLTGATNGQNSFGRADLIKIEDVTIDRTAMTGSSAAMIRGEVGDSLWLHDVVYYDPKPGSIIFQVPDIWITQSEFTGVGRSLATVGSGLNAYRIRGVEAEDSAISRINGQLLVGSDLQNLTIFYPTTATSSASGSIVAYNEIGATMSSSFLNIVGTTATHGVAVLGNTFDAFKSGNVAVDIAGGNGRADISNVIFHHNTVLNERMNIGYNDTAGENFDKNLFSVKWNQLHQFNTKHDVFSKDQDNTGAWSVHYGVGFQENTVDVLQAGGRLSAGFAFDGLGSTVAGAIRSTFQSDIPEIILHPPALVAIEDVFSVNEDTLLNVFAGAGVLANDNSPSSPSLVASIVSGPQHGALSLNGDGSFYYRPNQNFHGQDVFSYVALSGSQQSAPISVTIVVNEINDAPVAFDDIGPSSSAGSIVDFYMNTILLNDSDVDGDTLSLSLVFDAMNGRAEIDAERVIFHINADASGDAFFRYMISDNRGASSSATVRVPVELALNEAPVFVSVPVFGVNENEDIPLILRAVDSDATQQVSYGISGGVDAALFKIDDANGTLSFIRAPDFEAPSDHNQDNVYEVSVFALDSATTPLRATQDLVITVRDVFESLPFDHPVPGYIPVQGSTADDKLYGKGTNDWISGGPGRDVLVGGRGDDILIGGSGADQFTFDGRGLKGLEIDKILDFSFDEGDVLILSSFSAGAFSSAGTRESVKVLHNGASAIVDSIQDIVELSSLSRSFEIFGNANTNDLTLKISNLDGASQFIQIAGLFEDYSRVMG